MCFYIVHDTNIGSIFETAKKTYSRHSATACSSGASALHKKAQGDCPVLDGIPVCLSFRVRNPAVLHHFPEGALRLVCLRGVHLAEIEGNTDHDVAPHDVAAGLRSSGHQNVRPPAHPPYRLPQFHKVAGHKMGCWCAREAKQAPGHKKGLQHARQQARRPINTNLVVCFLALKKASYLLPRIPTFIIKKTKQPK